MSSALNLSILMDWECRFPKSSKAAINFKNQFSLDLEKTFNLFSIIGDDIYYNINGRYSLQKKRPIKHG